MAKKVAYHSRTAKLTDDQKQALAGQVGGAEYVEIHHVDAHWLASDNRLNDLGHNRRVWEELACGVNAIAGDFPPIALEALTHLYLHVEVWVRIWSDDGTEFLRWATLNPIHRMTARRCDRKAA